MHEAAKIGDYAAIGDGRSVALLARTGDIDWLCWPRFDSAPLFWRLIDAERGGAWRLAPTGEAAISRRYVEDSNVIETRFDTGAGHATLTDAMIVAPDGARHRRSMPEHEIARWIQCDRGTVDIAMRFAPRPGFHGAAPKLVDAGRFGIRCETGRALVTLRGDRPVAITAGSAQARFILHAGEAAAFSLSFDAEAPAVLPPLGAAAHDRIDETIDWWRAWLRTLHYRGRYATAVTRSVLAIKLLSYAPSGAVIAAATTSLPERIGGALNWDYRYCWLRDAAFTTRAMYALGFPDEAAAFSSWTLHTTRLSRPALRVLYDVYGNVPDDEVELAQLAGYRGSRPVRIGNAAAAQLQLDCYGEVIDSAAQLAYDLGHLDRDSQEMLRGLGRFICDHWRLPDHGIWEDRGAPRHRTHSKVLCWVGLDRLLELGRAGLIRRLPVDELAAQRDAIRAEVLSHGYDRGLDSYVDSYGGTDVDTSLLLLPSLGFDEADSPRMCGTWRRIEEHLAAGPGLFYRNERAIRDGEGAFGISSFWAADYLARRGRLDQACRVFEATLRHSNDVGLFAEEIDLATGDALGNFPQAYTHVGLINAALTIAEVEAGAQAPVVASQEAAS